MTIKGNVDLICVPPHMFGEVWQRCGHILLRGMHAARDVPVLATMDAIRFGQVQLWLVTRDDGQNGDVLAAFLTQIIDYHDDGRWVSLFALAGRRPRLWASMVGERMDAYAKVEGARGFRFCGKRGWERALPRAVIVGERAPGVFAFQRSAP
jgi:hypothetical protein